ncbi:hypothetical protein OG562_45585 [Streptomyces sp. NBC_01275]|uniref:hypothetical protein n=1 Tax=Streptomyces sp. NBC_01275 TaxID=2903807 RepID=UPI00224C8669|nr:hypothetical protein [Streptomyces sp. NBC_01275]MCX4768068.1 hypothetical protein [Streptomyces sp. NBC_01275]
MKTLLESMAHGRARCMHCDDQCPVDAAGACLLVDPTVDPTTDDPADHLFLLLRCGEYDFSSKKGEHTIRVFGLQPARSRAGA